MNCLVADCMVTGFTSLLQIEQRIVKTLKDLHAKKSNRMSLSFLSGSHGQGSFSAGWFFNPDKNNIDIDVEHQVESETIPEQCVHNVADKPGYLRIIYSCFGDILSANYDLEQISIRKSKYIQSYQIKDASKIKWITKNPVNITDVRIIYKWISGSKAILDIDFWRLDELAGLFHFLSCW